MMRVLTWFLGSTLLLSYAKVACCFYIATEGTTIAGYCNKTMAREDYYNRRPCSCIATAPMTYRCVVCTDHRMCMHQNRCVRIPGIIYKAGENSACSNVKKGQLQPGLKLYMLQSLMIMELLECGQSLNWTRSTSVQIGKVQVCCQSSCIGCKSSSVPNPSRCSRPAWQLIPPSV